jgi:shikimate dehydrogenase
MLKAGVIGHPVAHAFSPTLHAFWLKRHNINGVYGAYDISPSSLKNEVVRLRDQGLRGVNVTVPHKQNVMDFCTTLTQEAQKIGAVNLIKFFPNGEIEGRNTDAHGFLESLKAHTNIDELKGKTALVIGAGGAARAICYALMSLGLSQIKLVNRTLGRAESLADDIPLTLYEWDEMDRALDGCDLIINASVCGMRGENDLHLNPHLTNSACIFYDVVYIPLMTKFLYDAHGAGRKTIDGLGMLLFQAQPSFHAFYDVMPTVDDELKRFISCAL